MTRRNKNKNIIDVEKSLNTFIEDYDLNARIFNDYQFRIDAYEDDGFFDWYHTSGTLVHNKNGGNKGFEQKFYNAKDVAHFIIKIDNWKEKYE